MTNPATTKQLPLWFITIDTIQSLDNDYSGLCLACGVVACGDTEPDAENYKCESCGEKEVTGSHWLIYKDNVKIIEWPTKENISW